MYRRDYRGPGIALVPGECVPVAMLDSCSPTRYRDRPGCVRWYNLATSSGQVNLDFMKLGVFTTVSDASFAGET